MVHTSLSQGGFQWEGLWNVGHLLPLWAPPEFYRLVFGGNTTFLIGTSCCETTQASGSGQGGGFGQQFPNKTVLHICLASVAFSIWIWQVKEMYAEKKWNMEAQTSLQCVSTFLITFKLNSVRLKLKALFFLMRKRDYKITATKQIKVAQCC